MPIPASGPLSFEEIEEEFGQIQGTNNRRLGSYRVSSTFGGITLPLDTTAGADNNTPIPSPGSPIAFSDFRNARLNIVVNCYDSGTNYTVDAKEDKYKKNKATVVGPGVIDPLPSDTSGKRIIIHVNKKFGSKYGDPINKTWYCALKTGSWTANTKLQLDVGGEGKIMGAGGRGGNPNHGSGNYGTSGLGIQQEGTVVNVLAGGAIIAGWAGGTGGARGSQKDWWNTRHADGGGGGGGAGLPAGPGGPAGGNGSQAGQAGSEPTGGEQGGAGGAGGDNAGEARGGTGHHGFDQTRTTGSGDDRIGAAIRRNHSSTSWSFGDAHITDNVWGAGKGGSGSSPAGVA